MDGARYARALEGLLRGGVSRRLRSASDLDARGSWA